MIETPAAHVAATPVVRKVVRSAMDTMILTPADVDSWKIPAFQRPLRINAKVREIAEELKHTETLRGVITLGMIDGDETIWLVDGQHRIEGFKLSGLAECLADVRILHFENMREMAEEFVLLNSSLVRMRPDDVLRGLETSLPELQYLRKQCEFIGYSNIRRKEQRGPVLSMSAVLRCWSGSGFETPSGQTGANSAQQLAEHLDQTSNRLELVPFLLAAHSAWGSDPEYYRLWGNLNLTMCMWLYRRITLDRDRSGNKRYVVLDMLQFRQCLMALSASTEYLDWLTGRQMGDRDRAPCYARLKALFAKRLGDYDDVTGKKVRLPQPVWAN